MEIEESEQDRESIEGCMSQSDDSDTGSDEDAVEVLCSLVEGETRDDCDCQKVLVGEGGSQGSRTISRSRGRSGRNWC